LLAVLVAACLAGRAYLFARPIPCYSSERQVPPSPSLTTPAGLGYGYDPHDYLFLAHRLSSGQGFTYEDGKPTAFRPPLLLAAIRPGFPSASTSPLWWNFAFSSLAILCIALVAARESGFFGFAAIILLLSFHPHWLQADAHIWSEPLYMLLVSLSVLLWSLQGGREPEAKRGVLLSVAGIALGLACLIRPFTLFAVAVAVIYLLTTPRRKTLAAAGIGFCLLSAVFPAAWMLRNHLAAGMPAALTTNGGMNLYIGNNPEGIHWASELDRSAAYREIMAGRTRAPEPEVDGAFYKRAVSYIKADPAAAFRRSFAKCREFLSLFPHSSTPRRALTLLILLPLMALGVVRGIRQERFGLVMAFALFITGLLAYSAYWVWWRLALPYMPLAWLLCLSGMSFVAERLRPAPASCARSEQAEAHNRSQAPCAAGQNAATSGRALIESEEPLVRS
jgi:hypothetical protein